MTESMLLNEENLKETNRILKIDLKINNEKTYKIELLKARL